MVVIINGITFSDVFNCGCNGCELAMVFNKGHEYSTMEEIESKLNDAGLSAGNFCFKGVSKWDYNESASFDDEKETSILCMIPENIRDNFQVVALQ